MSGNDKNSKFKRNHSNQNELPIDFSPKTQENALPKTSGTPTYRLRSTRELSDVGKESEDSPVKSKLKLQTACKKRSILKMNKTNQKRLNPYATRSLSPLVSVLRNGKRKEAEFPELRKVKRRATEGQEDVKPVKLDEGKKSLEVCRTPNPAKLSRKLRNRCVTVENRVSLPPESRPDAECDFGVASIKIEVVEGDEDKLVESVDCFTSNTFEKPYDEKPSETGRSCSQNSNEVFDFSAEGVEDNDNRLVESVGSSVNNMLEKPENEVLSETGRSSSQNSNQVFDSSVVCDLPDKSSSCNMLNNFSDQDGVNEIVPGNDESVSKNETSSRCGLVFCSNNCERCVQYLFGGPKKYFSSGMKGSEESGMSLPDVLHLSDSPRIFEKVSESFDSENDLSANATCHSLSMLDTEESVNEFMNEIRAGIPEHNVKALSPTECHSNSMNPSLQSVEGNVTLPVLDIEHLSLLEDQCGHNAQNLSPKSVESNNVPPMGDGECNSLERQCDSNQKSTKGKENSPMYDDKVTKTPEEPCISNLLNSSGKSFGEIDNPTVSRSKPDTISDVSEDRTDLDSFKKSMQRNEKLPCYENEYFDTFDEQLNQSSCNSSNNYVEQKKTPQFSNCDSACSLDEQCGTNSMISHDKSTDINDSTLAHGSASPSALEEQCNSSPLNCDRELIDDSPGVHDCESDGEYERHVGNAYSHDSEKKVDCSSNLDGEPVSMNDEYFGGNSVEKSFEKNDNSVQDSESFCTSGELSTGSSLNSNQKSLEIIEKLPIFYNKSMLEETNESSKCDSNQNNSENYEEANALLAQFTGDHSNTSFELSEPSESGKIGCESVSKPENVDNLNEIPVTKETSLVQACTTQSFIDSFDKREPSSIQLSGEIESSDHSIISNKPDGEEAEISDRMHVKDGIKEMSSDLSSHTENSTISEGESRHEVNTELFDDLRHNLQPSNSPNETKVAQEEIQEEKREKFGDSDINGDVRDEGMAKNTENEDSCNSKNDDVIILELFPKASEVKEPTTKVATAIEDDSAEQRAIKETILNALGLQSSHAASLAKSTVRQELPPIPSRTSGTLKTIIKVPKMADRRRGRNPMKAVFGGYKASQEKDYMHSRGSVEDRGEICGPLSLNQAAAQDPLAYQFFNESCMSSSEPWDAHIRKHKSKSHGHSRKFHSGDHLSHLDHLSDPRNSMNGINPSSSVDWPSKSCQEIDPNVVSDGSSNSGRSGQQGSAEGSGEPSLVIPEKSASFSIHPERLCQDVCCYCFGKFGSLDTPMHLAQMKGEEKRRSALALEAHLSPDSCLCDACYRYLDRKASCPSYQPYRRQSGVSGGILTKSQVCCVRGCSLPAHHLVRRKWLTRLRRTISKLLPIELAPVPSQQQQPLHVPLCSRHFYCLEYYSLCGICKRKLSRNNMHPVGREVNALNAVLVDDAIPVTLTGKVLLCKMCRYYSGIRLKYRDKSMLSSGHKVFFDGYRKRIWHYLGIQTMDSSEISEPIEIPKKRKRSRLGEGESSKNIGSDNLQKSAERTTHQSVEIISCKSGNEISTSKPSASSIPTKIRFKLGNVSIEQLDSIDANKKESKGHLTSGSHRGKSDSAKPKKKSSVDNTPNSPCFPGMDQLGLNASFVFHGNSGSEKNKEWEKCTTTIQFDSRTKKLWQSLYYPYGNFSSFIRHLVIMEKNWRSGDLILAPNASSQAVNYVNSAQNRIAAYEGNSPRDFMRTASSALGSSKPVSSSAPLSVSPRPASSTSVCPKIVLSKSHPSMPSSSVPPSYTPATSIAPLSPRPTSSTSVCPKIVLSKSYPSMPPSSVPLSYTPVTSIAPLSLSPRPTSSTSVCPKIVLSKSYPSIPPSSDLLSCAPVSYRSVSSLTTSPIVIPSKPITVPQEDINGPQGQPSQVVPRISMASANIPQCTQPLTAPVTAQYIPISAAANFLPLNCGPSQIISFGSTSSFIQFGGATGLVHPVDNQFPCFQLNQPIVHDQPLLDNMECDKIQENAYASNPSSSSQFELHISNVRSLADDAGNDSNWEPQPEKQPSADESAHASDSVTESSDRGEEPIVESDEPPIESFEDSELAPSERNDNHSYYDEAEGNFPRVVTSDAQP